jgi:hypothetical protein
METILRDTCVKGIRLFFMVALMFVLVLALTMAFGEATPVSATNGTTYYVNANEGDNDYGDGTEFWVDNDSNGYWSFGDIGPWKTIGHAVDQCIGNETIIIAAGDYNAMLGENFPITFDTKLTLDGAGAETTTIDANGSNEQVLTINTGAMVTISGVTITGGATGDGTSGGANGGTGGIGGGILNLGTLMLNNSTVCSNTTGNGGVGSVSGGDGGYGGGICNFGGVMTLTNSTVWGNSTGNGATGDTYMGDGGHGGGIYNLRGTMILMNSTVWGNTAGNGANVGNGGCGGGIGNYMGMMVLINSTVSGNTSGVGGDGGGIDNRGGKLTLTASTVCSNNTGPGGSGGGINNINAPNGYSGILALSVVKNTIIADNTATGDDSDFYGLLTSLGCNLIEDTTDCVILGDETGNIYDEDPLLGLLQHNGGPTKTHALQSSSPAIDAVLDECGCTSIDDLNVTTDQRGEPRPMDGDSINSFLCDIGAYEANGTLPPSPYNEGYEAGFINGYNNGYQAGYKSGYNDGYQAGLQDCPSGKIVGGNVYLIDKIVLLAPWIALAIVIIAGGIFLFRRRVLSMK